MTTTTTATFKRLDGSTDVISEGSCSTIHNNKLYSYGGLKLQKRKASGDDVPTPIPHNKLSVFDPDSDKFTEMDEVTGGPLVTFASLSSVEDSLYLIGGMSCEEEDWSNAVHKYHMGSKKWTKVTCTGSAPCPRDKHVTTVVDRNIFLFGGFGPGDAGSEDESEDEDDFEEKREQIGATFTWFNDVFIFNTENSSWSHPMLSSLNKPSPRAAATWTSDGAGNLYLFGGKTSQGRVNDVAKFDTKKLSWTCTLDTKGSPPEARSFHAACLLSPTQMAISGGRNYVNKHLADLFILNLDTLVWTEVILSEGAMESRGCHQLMPSGDELYVLGGVDVFVEEFMICTRPRSHGYKTKLDLLTKSGQSPPEKPQTNKI